MSQSLLRHQCETEFYSYQPKISPKGRSTLPVYLENKKKTYEELREALEREKMKECTFKPDLDKTQLKKQNFVSEKH